MLVESRHPRTTNQEANIVTGAAATTVGNSGAVTVERRESIALIRFAGPSRANPLSVAVMRDLIAAVRLFEDDGRTAAIVVAGRDEAFSGGLDLRDEATRGMAQAALEERRALADTGRRLVDTLSGLAPVTIAAIEGPCLGGGLALAAALDLRVAGRSAVFGAPEVAVGLNMGWGSLGPLAAIAGVQVTRRLVLAGARLDTAQAEVAGLVDEVAPDGEALDRALALATRMAAYPVAPLRMAKRALAAIVRASGTATALDTDQFVAAAGSREFSATLARFALPRSKQGD
jgi:enoyl-CoA hydratase/carnithine racemase